MSNGVFIPCALLNAYTKVSFGRSLFNPLRLRGALHYHAAGPADLVQHSLVH